MNSAELDLLVNALRPRTRIVVTGPQRSGTTISARILADELGYEFLPEERIRYRNLLKFFQLYASLDRFVLQAPCLCAFAHVLPACIVLVRRDVEEIIKSQERIGWSEYERRELRNYFVDTGPIAEVRYSVWDRYQKPNMSNAFELKYESLRGHRLWV
jgi:hypothetical protein